VLFIYCRKQGKKKQKFRLWRQKFMAGLRSVGLDIEEVNSISYADQPIT
jgi:hypothetical protein